MILIALISTGRSLSFWGESVFGSSGSDSAKCLPGACALEPPEKPQRKRRRKQGTQWAGWPGPAFSVEKAFLSVVLFSLFPLTFWLLFTFPGFLKPQGRNLKEDTHGALKGRCLPARAHVRVCVHIFMYVSRWTGRAYFLSEKPVGCAQNEVLSRMLSHCHDLEKWELCEAVGAAALRGAVLSVLSRPAPWCPGRAAALSISKSCPPPPWWFGSVKGWHQLHRYEQTPINEVGTAQHHFWPNILRDVEEGCSELWSLLRPK